MPDWRSEYLSSFKDAELSSQMADRISALEAEKAALEASRPSAAGRSHQKQASGSGGNDDPTIAQLRLDLAEAMRSKGVSEARLRAAEEELDKLRIKTKSDTKNIKALDVERAALIRRLKDREHELREKRKLVENVQDEMITLNLQLSLAEKERDKVKKENKELVDRWMKRMGQEAEAMNLANETKS
ncbi:Autophagy protein 16 (ATG16) [Geosmithia morbida]|uniref:Autophagy protein 16 (ATG16) n=1 Tax=Geosmithia morbida TaxID=1094350 RepID=A0A9P4YPJ1_9HYPO|nr:Autophagy protein 16 (ATG16) [Geosmithia morbida]KAF4120360.1 Autophagy protein 16 (ATG16) [Geosmithia morbida]